MVCINKSTGNLFFRSRYWRGLVSLRKIIIETPLYSTIMGISRLNILSMLNIDEVHPYFFNPRSFVGVGQLAQASRQPLINRLSGKNPQSRRKDPPSFSIHYHSGARSGEKRGWVYYCANYYFPLTGIFINIVSPPEPADPPLRKSFYCEHVIY